MAKNLEFGIKLSLDTKEGEGNLAALTRAFNQALRELGKTDDEVKAFHALALDVAAGRRNIEDLDESTRSLLETFRAAYDRLKASGVTRAPVP